jgi:hypothetical protein
MAAPTPREFFEALWSDIRGGDILLRLIGCGQDSEVEVRDVRFAWPAGIDEMLGRAFMEAGWNAYYGIGIRSVQGTGPHKVFAVPALWHTFNLNVVPLDKAVGAIKAFPLRPSAGFRAGDVLTAVWFIEGSFCGETELRGVWPANLKLAAKLMASLGEAGGHEDPLLVKANLAVEHRQPQGVLRVPGSTNYETSQPQAVEFVSWNPGLRHDFEQFYKILVDTPAVDKEEPKVEPAKPTKPKQAAVPDEDEDGPKPRDIATDLNQKLANAMTKVWIEGFREKIAMLVAGGLAHGNYTKEAALRLVRAVCTLTGDPDIPRFEEIIERTFKRHDDGDRVAGWPTLEKLIDEFPGALRDEAKRAFELIRKSVPKPPKGGGGGGSNGRGRADEPDFDIVELVRYTSEPARYRVHLKLHAEKAGKTDLDVHVEEGDVYSFDAFREKTFGQAHIYLAKVSQTAWEVLVEKAPFKIEEAPPEAKPSGAIASALEEFVEDKKEDPELGDLKSYPGYDETDVFFRLPTFKGFLKDQGVRFTDREILHQIKELGWKRETKRFGQATAKIWLKPLQNGHTEEKPPEGLFEPGTDASGGMA